ncbi:single-stranded DNA-binding protein, partial [Salmonella enterica]|nr:single-stranded DNA-binding protein [Salmonella enterica]
YTTEVLVNVGGTMQMLGRRDSQPQQGGQQFSGQPQPEPQTLAPAAKGEGKAAKGTGKSAKGKNAAPQQPPAQPDPAYDFDDDIPF